LNHKYKPGTLLFRKGHNIFDGIEIFVVDKVHVLYVLGQRTASYTGRQLTPEKTTHITASSKWLQQYYEL
jgi:hypothetical protein